MNTKTIYQAMCRFTAIVEERPSTDEQGAADALGTCQV